jgi:hypothetical protein
VRALLKGRGEQLLTALVITLVLLGLVALVPAVGRRLNAQPATSATPSPTLSAPPAAVLLPDELDKALQGVMTIANDRSFGTAFLIDAQGDFLTASSLVDGSGGLRLIDNTGGTHAVRLIGSDATLGVAMVRATTDGNPLAIGDSATIQAGAPIVLLASPKIANLNPSTPATTSAITSSAWKLQVDDLPGNLGGPLVGAGAKVVALLTRAGTGLPIDAAMAEISTWRGQSGTAVPLAPFPSGLELRGSDTTSSPGAGVSVASVNPARVSAGQDSVVTIQGSGFQPGAALRVRFLPVAGSNGGFDGIAPAVANASTITLKVPAGHAVQDYVIELINGDGTTVDSRVAFTITP